jgi:hypothetical protein
MLRKFAGLISKTGSSLESWFTPDVETVSKLSDNILDPNTILLLLTKPFDRAQPLP